MFAFLFKKAPPAEEVDLKITKRILGFLGAEEIIEVLPQVHSFLKKELESTYAEIRAIAYERVLIYKRTLKPYSIFPNPDNFEFIKLSGGYSNTTYKLSKDSKTYISRIGGVGTGLIIDRTAEWHNASIAEELKLNPPIVYNDKKGNQLSHFLPSPQPLTPELLLTEPAYLAEIAAQLQKLHHSPKRFLNDINVFKRNRDFYALIKGKELVLPEPYFLIQTMIARLELLFEHFPIPQAPCHNDTYFNNFILSDGKIWLIDWEYSGNNDPIWDLAYFSNLAKLDEKQNAELLSSYFECADFQSKYHLEYLRFVAYGLVVKDFIILWTYVQLANKNMSVTESEFLKWSESALEDSVKIMSSDAFSRAILELEEASKKCSADTSMR